MLASATLKFPMIELLQVPGCRRCCRTLGPGPQSSVQNRRQHGEVEGYAGRGGQEDSLGFKHCMCMHSIA